MLSTPTAAGASPAPNQAGHQVPEVLPEHCSDRAAMPPKRRGGSACWHPSQTRPGEVHHRGPRR
eukprot:3860046-Alexandrium_andersonii.AAC.1